MSGISADGIRAGFDARTGLLDGFAVLDEGREIAPMHRAPWVGTDEVMPEGASPHMATLGGDFFCCPFAGSEEGSHLHGWPANAPWHVIGRRDGRLQAVLSRSCFGAVLVKDLAVVDGHPFVYQRHVFVGGQGRASFANHANITLPGGGHIRTSRKTMWETPGTPQESDPARGRSALVYPAQGPDPSRFPAKGGTVDLTRYPWRTRHEDFVVGIEAPDTPLGWTAVTRIGQGDLYLALRNPRQAPMTMLWHSDGGRDYAPWSGRHRHCLGVEEGAADHMLGLSAEADLAGPGALALAPGAVADVRNVIGAIAWACEEPVAEVRLSGDTVGITGEGGTHRRLPVDAAFLGLGDR